VAGAKGSNGSSIASVPEAAGEGSKHDWLSLKWIFKVARTADNDLRAHRIALTYSHLARRLDDLIEPVKPPGRRTSRNANWFNFATWGTLTVSQNIGNQRPLQRLNNGLGMPLRRLLTPAVLNVKASGGQEVARALAWGQLRIFVSSCIALRQFVNHVGIETNFAAQALVDEVELPKPPAKSAGTFSIDLQRHAAPIADAFQLYSRARDASSPQTRARFVLGANVMLTEVEQDMADGAVSVVLDLVPKRVAGAFDWRLARLAERFRGVPPHLSYLVLPYLHADERRALDAVWSRFMTDQVLVMALPTETLRVGRDIPPRDRRLPYYPADMLFPRDLKELERDVIRTHHGDDPNATACAACVATIRALKDVAQRVRSLDRTVGNGRGSGARDWRRWDERMNWAVTLLRTRQHDDTLFWRPYSKRDAERIFNGDLPLRSGDPSALEVQPPIDEDADQRANNTLEGMECL
jgi:hypothetical protein